MGIIWNKSTGEEASVNSRSSLCWEEGELPPTGGEAALEGEVFGRGEKTTSQPLGPVEASQDLTDDMFQVVV